LTQALYRRWRPQDFDDVIGQEHITRTLRNALEADRLAHAYLFTGPRGTGKTSVARILAKAVNCLGDGPRPCNDCAICTAVTEGRLLDLVEIDAASNTGVDDVRDLRDKVNFVPNEARYKVYIVDEVHMLSTAAFNALLKTLEEPPGHVIFILATTEPHKIPDTILSRCQRHDFHRVPVDAVVAKLERICEAEDVEADAAALEIVARSATGSIRDAESLMDLLMSVGDRITPEAVQEILGTAGGDAVVGIANAIAAGDAAGGLRWINRALDAGADPRQFQNQLLDYLRGLLLIQTGIDDSGLNVTAEQLSEMKDLAGRLPTSLLIPAMRRFNDAKPSADRGQPGLPLELALVETILGSHPDAAPTAAASAAAPSTAKASASARPSQRRPEAGPPVASPETSAQGARAKATQTPPARATSSKAAQAPTADEDRTAAKGADAVPAGTATEGPEAPDALSKLRQAWEPVIEAVAREDKNLAALLKDGKPLSVDADAVTLGFFYEFHCRRVAEPARSERVRRAMAEVTGIDRDLRCTVVEATRAEKHARPSNKADQARKDPLIQHAVDELGARISTVHDEE
jgi:DNA polymerase-3 subunit gamma/tau